MACTLETCEGNRDCSDIQTGDPSGEGPRPRKPHERFKAVPVEGFEDVQQTFFGSAYLVGVVQIEDALEAGR